MPLVKYCFRHPEGHELTEEDFFMPERLEYQVGQVVYLIPNAKIIKIEITNPFVHAHTWKKRSLNMFAMKSWYQCDRCKVTGYKRLLPQGEVGSITRSVPYQATKYERCHDQLKKLPTKLYIKEIHYVSQASK